MPIGLRDTLVQKAITLSLRSARRACRSDIRRDAAAVVGALQFRRSGFGREALFQHGFRRSGFSREVLFQHEFRRSGFSREALFQHIEEELLRG
jgi:hypothetical protein